MFASMVCFYRSASLVRAVTNRGFDHLTNRGIGWLTNRGLIASFSLLVSIVTITEFGFLLVSIVTNRRLAIGQLETRQMLDQRWPGFVVVRDPFLAAPPSSLPFKQSPCPQITQSTLHGGNCSTSALDQTFQRGIHQPSPATISQDYVEQESVQRLYSVLPSERHVYRFRLDPANPVTSPPCAARRFTLQSWRQCSDLVVWRHFLT